MIDPAFETMQFGGEQAHDLAMNLVLGCVDEPAKPTRDLFGHEMHGLADDALAVVVGGRHDLLAIDAGDLLDHVENGVDGPADRLADVDAITIARPEIVARKIDDLLVPATAVLIQEDEIVRTHERLLPRGQRRRRITTELVVGALHDVEGVVVEAEQHVQTVLFDSLVVISVSTTRGLATQPPSRLVHGHVMPLSEFFSCSQLERGRDGTSATAQYCNAGTWGFDPEAPICRYDRLRPTTLARTVSRTVRMETLVSVVS